MRKSDKPNSVRNAMDSNPSGAKSIMLISKTFVKNTALTAIGFLVFLIVGCSTFSSDV